MRGPIRLLIEQRIEGTGIGFGVEAGNKDPLASWAGTTPVLQLLIETVLVVGKRMKTGILVTSIVFALTIQGCGYNQIQGADEAVKAAWAEVQNQYQRRQDLIPNLVRVVSGYASHERETLTAVTEARAKAVQIPPSPEMPSKPEDFRRYQEAQAQLSGALGRLMVVVERYPDLKANENFRDLQSQLEGTENRIAVARNRYIRAVEEYNKLIRFFPTNLTARYLLGLSIRETFTVPDKNIERAPEVKF